MDAHYTFPQRFSTSVENFSYTEKFDTWLNLGAWAFALDYLDTIAEWSDVNVRLIGSLFNEIDRNLLTLRSMTPKMISRHVISPLLPAMIISSTLSRPTTTCHIYESEMRKYRATVERATIQAFIMQTTHLMSCFGPNALEIVQSYDTNWDQVISGDSKILIGFMSVYEDLLLVINVHKSLVSVRPCKDKFLQAQQILKLPNQTTIHLPSLNATIIVYSNFMTLVYDGTTWLCPVPYFLEIYNKVSETISLLKYAQIQSKTIYGTKYLKDVERFLNHLCQQVLRNSSYGVPGVHNHTRSEQLEMDNRGFVYLKAIEGLGVAELIYRSDLRLGWTNSTLTETLWSALYKEHLVTSRGWKESETARLFSAFDEAQLAGILGIIKLAGHPSIEVERGLEKLYERTHNEIDIDPVKCDRARAIMTRDIIKNFFRVHGRFPHLQEWTVNAVPNLRKLIQQNLSIVEAPGSSIWKSITIDEWKLIRFCQNAEFDEVDNQVMLLKDKALGYCRSAVMNRIMLESQGDHVPKDQRNHRRALIAFLLDSQFDSGFRRYLARYMSDEKWGSAVLDYLVIKLTAKELEEKVEGRYFGASPAYERNRRVVQEANNMAFMDKYVPEQLLTPNELAVIRKMYSFRSLSRAHPNSYVLNISFDFSKWNNNMRHESVDIPAGTVLDDWFGVNLYSKTMRAFENMLVYYDDGIVKRHWVGQKGGIEGLNQATWTFTFLGGLKDALESLGYVYHITVKGDDVRCALVIPKKDLNALMPNQSLQVKIESVKDSLLSELQRLCSAMGWELNPQESFVSLSLIATSKQYQINDTWLPTDSKKIMKLEALSNVAFPTIEDIISNIYSTAHSACSQATVAAPAYIVATWTAARLLYRSIHHKRNRFQILPDIVTLLLWPQIVGGPGALPLQTFFVRGENDMLSVALSMIVFLTYTLDSDDPVRRRLGFILRQNVKKDSDPVMLLSDPYSIDIDCPPRPASIIKSKIRSQLVRVCKQPDILKLLKSTGERQRSSFISTLYSLTPYYAKIATALWECSPFYLIEEILAKFLNSASIIGFLTQGASFNVFSYGGYKILTLLSELSQKRLDYWCNVLDGRLVRSANMYFGLIPVEEVEAQPCKTWFSGELRNRAWGKLIKGLTYPSLVDQNKIYSTEDIEWLSLERGWDTRNTYSQICLKHLQAIPQFETNSHHFSSAPNVFPWLGSQTRSSVSLPFHSENIASPSIRKLRRLLTLLSSANIFGSQFEEVIVKLLEAYTPVDISLLRLLCPNDGGGHLAHRTPINSYSLTTMPNYRPNLSQLLIVNNENMDILKLDNVNRTINFAARHFFLTPMVLWPLQGSARLHESYPQMFFSTFHHNNLVPHYSFCPYCNAVVDDEPVHMDVHPDFQMTHFLQFKIISCSHAETTSLEQAIVDTLRKGVITQLDKLRLNSSNPLIVQHAVVATFQRLLASMSDFRQHMALEGIMQVPNSELMDVLATGVGVRSFSSRSISISVLRSCKPRFIVISLLKEAYWHSVKISYQRDTLYQDPPLGDLLPFHYEDFSTLFNQLAKAGLLSALVRAADYPDELDMRDNDPYFRIIFRHGSEKSGLIAAQSFFSSVWPMFNAWVDSFHAPNILLNPLIEGRNSEEIMRRISTQQSTIIGLCFHLMHLMTVVNHGSTKTILKNTYHHLTPYLDMEEHTDQEKCDKYIHEIARKSHMCLVRIYLIVTLSHWMTRVTPTMDDIKKCTLNNEALPVVDIDPDLLMIYLTGEVEFKKLKDYPHGSKGMIYICKVLPYFDTDEKRENLWSSLFQTVTPILYDVPELAEEGLAIMQHSLRVLRPLLSVQPFISCPEIDESIIRNYRKNLTEDAIAREYPSLQIHPLTRSEQENPMLPYDPTVYCRLGHSRVTTNPDYNVSHWKVTGLTQTTLQCVRQIEQYIAAVRTQFSRKQILVDQRNQYKIFGGLNKSAVKYLYPLQSIGCLTWFQHIDNPVCVMLGDGGGSCSRLLTSLYPGCKCILVSLQITNSDPTTNLDEFHSDCPAELQSSIMNDEQRLRIIYQGLFPGDFTIPAIQNIIKSTVQRMTDYPHLIIGEADMPTSMDGALKMISEYLRIYDHNHNASTLLLIRLSWANGNIPCQMLLTLRYLFHHFHIFPITTSTMTRGEMIIGMSDSTTESTYSIFASQTDSNYLDYIAHSNLHELVHGVHGWMSSCISLMYDLGLMFPIESDEFPRFSRIITLPIAPLASIIQYPSWLSKNPRNGGCPCQIVETLLAELYKYKKRLSVISSRLPCSPTMHKLREDFMSNLTYQGLVVKELVATTLFIDLIDHYIEFKDLMNLHDVIGYSLSSTLHHLDESHTVKSIVKNGWISTKSLTHDTRLIELNSEVQNTIDIFIRLISAVRYQLTYLRQTPDSEVILSERFWCVPNNPQDCCRELVSTHPINQFIWPVVIRPLVHSGVFVSDGRTTAYNLAPEILRLAQAWQLPGQ
ncbi:polymerase [Shayang Fly Virus 1]|uniref:RNA-directed RNA polymerase n=1 Tax=Shayang Fly Virus 1 TaxID=1608065 RepID=A0A0B5KEN7_9VIRU|nr:polymerase [Shayang Fly Virus 1]AJG39054.1 polymerase [Shayang Fly Virus 1]